jgi:metal-responsive CopG/Arc/MetJ family transcriptional regulator
MRGTTKIAISMSGEEFEELEALRKEEGLSRSRLIVEAVKHFKEEKEKDKLIRIYKEGYKRIPETLQLAEGWERVSLDSFSDSCGEW